MITKHYSGDQIKKNDMSGGQGRGKVHTEFWWGNLSERGHLEDPNVDVKIILKLIFKKRDGGGGAWTGCGSCKCGNEPSCSIKRGEFLDQKRVLVDGVT